MCEVDRTLCAFPNMYTPLNQALLRKIRISESKHVSRCHVGSIFTVETYLITVYLLHYPKRSTYRVWDRFYKQICEGLLLKTKDVTLLQWFILPITMYK